MEGLVSFRREQRSGTHDTSITKLLHKTRAIAVMSDSGVCFCHGLISGGGIGTYPLRYKSIFVRSLHGVRLHMITNMSGSRMLFLYILDFQKHVEAG